MIRARILWNHIVGDGFIAAEGLQDWETFSHFRHN